MALRKDKVAAALREMRGICSDPNNPASLPEVVGQLANILGNVFDDLALPELPQIDSGEFSLPEDAPFDFPLGGGTQRSLDINDGALGRFPGGGQPFGGFDDGGDPGGGGDGQQPELGQGCLEIFTAKTKTEIPASSDGSPGEGFVIQMALAPKTQDDKDVENDDDLTTAQDIFNCRQKCKQENGNNLELFFTPEEIEGMNEEERDAALLVEEADCYAECNENLSLQESGFPLTVYNISCEKIEKDKTVIVSYDICQDVGYVLVEACGCD